MKMTGMVVHGDGYGKQLGFPTANIDIDVSAFPIDSGIYAAEAMVNGDNTIYQAAVFLDHKRNRLEVHLLAFDQDVYGQEMSVLLLEKVSEQQPQPSHEALQQKIAADVKKVATYFSSRKK